MILDEEIEIVLVEFAFAYEDESLFELFCILLKECCGIAFGIREQTLQFLLRVRNGVSLISLSTESSCDDFFFFGGLDLLPAYSVFFAMALL